MKSKNKSKVYNVFPYSYRERGRVVGKLLIITLMSSALLGTSVSTVGRVVRADSPTLVSGGLPVVPTVSTIPDAPTLTTEVSLGGSYISTGTTGTVFLYSGFFDGLIDFGKKAIDTTVKVTNAVGKAVGSGLSSAGKAIGKAASATWDFITSPFKRDSDKKSESSSGSNNNTSNNNKSSSNATGSSSSSNKVEAVSQNEGTTDDSKPSISYTGGLDANLTDAPTREFVQDSRRSSTDAIRYISDDPATASLMENVSNNVNSEVKGQYLLVYSSDGMLSFSNKVYSTLEDKDKRRVMEKAVKLVKESDLPSTAKNKVSKFIAEQDPTLASTIEALNSDTSSELSSGYALFKPFGSPISTVVGFLAIVIMVMLTTSIVFDLAYLVLGFVRLALDNATEDGNKPKFVTSEAVETAKEIDGMTNSGDYKDYISTYVKKRSGIFIFASILLAWLISGQIYDVIIWGMEIFEEIFLNISSR